MTVIFPLHYSRANVIFIMRVSHVVMIFFQSSLDALACLFSLMGQMITHADTIKNTQKRLKLCHTYLFRKHYVEQRLRQQAPIGRSVGRSISLDLCKGWCQSLTKEMKCAVDLWLAFELCTTARPVSRIKEGEGESNMGCRRRRNLKLVRHIVFALRTTSDTCTPPYTLDRSIKA